MNKFVFASIIVMSASSAAVAADLGPAPVAVYDWTGFYVGGNLGAAINKLHRRPKREFG